MKYGRTEHGEKWHMLRSEDRALCFDGTKIFVELRDDKPQRVEDVCENCDKWLRLPGEVARKEHEAAVKRQPKPKDVYEPRRRWKD